MPSIGEQVRDAIRAKNPEVLAAAFVPEEGRVQEAHQRATVLDLLKGPEYVISQGQKYLLPHKSEYQQTRVVSVTTFAKGYDRRLAVAVLYPGVERAVNQAVGRVCRRPIQLLGTDNVVLLEVEKNVDRLGHDLHTFSKRAFRDAVAAGFVVIFCDYPKAPANPDGTPMRLTREQEAQLALRPVWRAYGADCVLGAAWDYPNDVPRLCFLRLLEESRELNPVTLQHVLRERVRLLWLEDQGAGKPPRVGYALLEREVKDKGEKGDVTVVEGPGVYSEQMDEIPVGVCYCDIDHGELSADPYFENLARWNLRDYNKQSDLDEIEYVANVPVPYLAGGNKDNAKWSEWNAELMWFLPKDAKVGYWEHSGKSIEGLKQSITEGREVQRFMSLEPMLPKDAGRLTASENETRADSAMSDIEAFARSLKACLERCWMLSAKYLQPRIVKPGLTLTVSLDATIEELHTSGEAASKILELRKLGDLSQETEWSELQRHGVLSYDFDPEKERQRLAAEALESEDDDDDEDDDENPDEPDGKGGEETPDGDGGGAPPANDDGAEQGTPAEADAE